MNPEQQNNPNAESQDNQEAGSQPPQQQPPQQNTPTDQAHQPGNNKNKNKNKNKKLVVAAIAVGILVLGTIAAIAIANYMGNTESRSNEDVGISTDNIEERLVSYASQLHQEFPSYEVGGERPESLHVYSETHGVFIYKPTSEGWGFSATCSQCDVEVDKEAADFLLSLFQADGFTVQHEDNLFRPMGDTLSSYAVENDEIICLIGLGAKAECFDTKGLDEAAASYLEEHLPFYKAYLKGEYGISVDSLTDAPIDKMNSFSLRLGGIEQVEEFPEYRIAWASAGSFGTLFYSKNNGEWVYGYGVQGMPDCDKLNSSDAAKAFHDKSCADSLGSTTFGEYHNIY
ncbi:MAG: hypothetical protein WDZ42_01360 [Candidatus Saccharimonadales bacterium]